MRTVFVQTPRTARLPPDSVGVCIPDSRITPTMFEMVSTKGLFLAADSCVVLTRRNLLNC